MDNILNDREDHSPSVILQYFYVVTITCTCILYFDATMTSWYVVALITACIRNIGKEMHLSFYSWRGSRLSQCHRNAAPLRRQTTRPHPCYEIWSTSGQYASYWNASMFWYNFWLCEFPPREVKTYQDQGRPLKWLVQFHILGFKGKVSSWPKSWSPSRRGSERVHAYWCWTIPWRDQLCRGEWVNTIH